MILHDHPAFPSPLRVRLVLEELGATDRVQFRTVDALAGEHRLAAFLARNPDGAIPVLELDDGTHLAESAVIAAYLDESVRAPGTPSLVGEDARTRAVVALEQRRVERGVLDALATWFHEGTSGLGDARQDRCQAWGLRQRAVAEAGMARFDALLRTRDFVAGTAYSVADIALYAGLGLADYLGVPIPETHEALHAWRRTVAARPAVVSVQRRIDAELAPAKAA